MARIALLPDRGSPAPSRVLFSAAGVLALVAYTATLESAAPMERVPWVMAAAFVAALVSSVAGFAFSALCGAFLFHLVDEPMLAVQIMMICSVGNQALMVWSLRRRVEWRILPVFLFGAAVGLPLGLLLLVQAQPGLHLDAVGALLVVYATFMMLRRPVVFRRQHVLLDVAAGFVGGVTGGAAAFPSAFVTAWCGLKGWSKERQRALCQPFILVVQLAAIALFMLWAWGSGSDTSFDPIGILYLPAVFLGTVLGLALFRRLDDRQCGIAVNVMLIVSGLGFLL